MKAVIFDIDGVICYTDQYHYQAWKKLADRLGIYFDEKMNNDLRGVGRMESLEIILQTSGKKYSKLEKEKMAEEKNKEYIKLLSKMTTNDLSPEVKTTLEKLRSRGYKLAIGSSSKNAKLILRQIGLENYFDAVSDGNNIKNAKPNPEVFLKAAEMSGEKASDCLVVEDATAGIEAAYLGGFQSAGIGEASKHHKVNYPIDSVLQLLEFL